MLFRKKTNNQILFSLTLFTILALPISAQAQSGQSVVVVVNSNQDGEIQPDNELTLREAIAIVNQTLEPERLSQAEKAQVQTLAANESSRIEFNLPPNQTTISLQRMLPPISTPGVVIDGTTQPGYDATGSATVEIAIPIPVVSITPAPNTKILRGLSIVADNVTVRGLSLYGFAQQGGATLNTPPADIFIDKGLPPPNVTEQPPISSFDLRSPRYGRNEPELVSPPQNVVIEQNWLGIPPDETVPTPMSAFGVWVFNGSATIRRNRIANHEGSGIITSVQAPNLLVTENIIVGNGLNGMPDAIRLEGEIDNSQITGNLICGNDGSGVYLFKPQGSVQIRNNQIIYNGRRMRRAAVYLMGDNHQVIDNQIRDQAGPGVVVSAYPSRNDVQWENTSAGNVIEKNQFAFLEGLSIDLNTQRNLGPIEFQRGDGHNPRRNSPNRRQETGNASINSPRFLSSEFFVLGSEVTLLGDADPDSTVEIYRVRENAATAYGPLSEPLMTVPTDEQGEFRATLTTLQPGDIVSAIATHPKYGTSEPALNAQIVTSDGVKGINVNPIRETTETRSTAIPQCTTAQTPIPPIETTPPPEPLTLRVPRQIHFALDQSTISPESAAILDQIAEVMRSYPVLIVEIQGHTDPRANDAYNQALGMRRAIAARNYLLRQGIEPERMTIRSFGEQERRTTGTDVVDYARDRRAEFIFKDVRGIDIIFEDQETDLQIESRGGRR